MADATAIQWADATWNPVTGCTKVSRGCRHCYIDRTPPFRMAGRQFVRGTTGVQLHPERLDVPLRWRKPRRVFVCSLADLFHDAVPDEFIARVFQTMRGAPAHTFQVLTKRPERALEWFSRCGDDEDLGWITHDATPPGGAYRGTGIVVGDHDRWPLPNVWVGVSIEDASYTWRADVLRQIPAAVRFISAEPLIGSLYESRPAGRASGEDETGSLPLETGSRPGTRPRRAPLDLSGIDWVIVGGESGPGARPFHLEHAREIIRACRSCCPFCGGTGRRISDSGYERVEGPCDCPVEFFGQQLRPAVFVKQLGAKPTERYRSAAAALLMGGTGEDDLVPLKLRDRKGGDITEWPADLRIREFPR